MPEHEPGPSERARGVERKGKDNEVPPPDLRRHGRAVEPLVEGGREVQFGLVRTHVQTVAHPSVQRLDRDGLPPDAKGAHLAQVPRGAAMKLTVEGRTRGVEIPTQRCTLDVERLDMAGRTGD